MGSLDRVPCVNVNNTNIVDIWSELVSSLQNASWIALDLEFSGLGSKENFKIKQVDERYQVFCDVVKSRSVVSIGLSTFRRVEQIQFGDNSNIRWRYHVSNYDILCRCLDKYEIDLDAHRFLSNHGFDFDKQVELGVSYQRGGHADDLTSPTVRNIFMKIIQHKTPIIFHNGFMDLIFLYQNFYCDLPADFQVFVSNLRDMFPMGIYDTKFISESAGGDVSFLEFVYYERQRCNVNNLMNAQPHVYIEFPDLLNDWCDVRNMKTRILEQRPDSIEVCKHYSYHGWCHYGVDCIKSHNIDFILDQQKLPSKHSRKRRSRASKLKRLSAFNENLDLNKESLPLDVITNTQVIEAATVLGRVKSGAHRSGYDAFMTGYAFAAYLSRNCEVEPFSRVLEPTLTGISDLVDKVYLSGKEQPLKIRSSGFSKSSKEHKAKLDRIRAACLS